MYALYVMYMRIPIFIGEIENILLRSYYNRCFFFFNILLEIAFHVFLRATCNESNKLFLIRTFNVF